MSERSTPETNALWDLYDRNGCCTARIKNKMAELERERDEAREKYFVMRDAHNNVAAIAEKYRRERDELRDILRKLLAIIPEPKCHDFGHTKKERHDFLEKCPVVARYDALIAQAKEAVK